MDRYSGDTGILKARSHGRRKRNGLAEEDFTMRFLRYLAVLGLFAGLMVIPATQSQAQVSVGIGVGPAYGGYVGAPVCSYGYYGYAPYACAPYGYYGPSWFNGGIFIG